MEFQFRLREISDITPWMNGQGQKTLSWFGLTDGWFWITIGNQELFRYSEAILNIWSQQSPNANPSLLPYEDYLVARYWEDLLEMLPAILDPLPADLAMRVADGEEWRKWQDEAERWRETCDDDTEWDAYYAAVTWWSQRTWDAGHLTRPPRTWFWRAEETIHVRWDNRDVTIEGTPVWEAEGGESEFPVSEFLAAVEGFNDRFLFAMGQQVDAAMATNVFPDVQLDLAMLQREQRERANWLEPAVAPATAKIRRPFSWDEVRMAMATVEREKQA